jgi:hypothetical protein
VDVTLSETDHDFTLVLTGIPDLTPDVENALFAAGCDDGTLAMRMGRPYITFSRRAPTLKDAVLRAIENVRNAGIGADVLRVDNCNLVTQAHIARKIDRSRQLVHQYMLGERGPGGFPPPVCGITDEVPLWRWCEVAYWLWQNHIVEENVLRDAEEVELINNLLELTRQKADNPDLMKQLMRSMSPGICS